MKSRKKSSEPKRQDFRQALKDKRFTDRSNPVQDALNKYNSTRTQG